MNIGPLIFTRNLGSGFRLWLNPVKRPVAFLLLGMPFILWDILMLALDCVWLLLKASFYFAQSLYFFISAIFLKFKDVA